MNPDQDPEYFDKMLKSLEASWGQDDLVMAKLKERVLEQNSIIKQQMEVIAKLMQKVQQLRGE